jgi:protein-S-isoprenylcysteine O-methyltransferase Ste14
VLHFLKDLQEVLAFLTVLIWPAIPLFWIPVHGFPETFRRLGLLSYAVPLALWLPLAFFIFTYKSAVLQMRIDLPEAAEIAGLILLILGALLQLWTGRLLGLLGLMGVPEISPGRKSQGLVRQGAFSLVRHPTYLSHTMMFAGVFLFSGVLAAGIVALLDFILSNVAIIPLEEKELEARFGEEYREYRRNVPRFFPCIG